MSYKTILYELLERYERASDRRKSRKVDKKGIDDIVEKYTATLDPESRTSNHVVQYAGFLQELVSTVAEKYVPIAKRWGHMLAGCLSGFAVGGFFGESVLSNVPLGMMCGVVAGTATAVAISYGHTYGSYALQVRGVVADYDRALKRVDILAMLENERKDELLLESAIAMAPGNRTLRPAVRKELKEYFERKLHGDGQLPPKDDK